MPRHAPHTGSGGPCCYLTCGASLCNLVHEGGVEDLVRPLLAILDRPAKLLLLRGHQVGRAWGQGGDPRYL